jgi:hypothetical protein
MLKQIKTHSPKKAVIAGGQAFAQYKPNIALKHFNVRILKSLSELEAFIKKIGK